MARNGPLFCQLSPGFKIFSFWGIFEKCCENILLMMFLRVTLFRKQYLFFNGFERILKKSNFHDPTVSKSSIEIGHSAVQLRSDTSRKSNMQEEII